jgi:hypothetical protein
MTCGRSLVFFWYVNDLWQVVGFLLIRQWLVAGRWFSSDTSMTCGRSLVFSEYVNDLWQVVGFLRIRQWLVAGRWFSPDTSMTCGRSLVFSGYSLFLQPIKTDRHDITEIMLKVTLNTITLTTIPAFHTYNFECTWWRVFQKGAVSNK